MKDKISLTSSDASARSTKSLLVYAGVLFLVLFLSACSFGQPNSPANSDDNGSKNVAMDGGSASMENVTPASPLSSRFERVEELVHEMPEDGMEEVHRLFPDLELVKTAAEGSQDNIVGMGPEDWLYSEEDNVTVIVCNSVNTPAYIFAGKTLSDEKLEEVKQMMAEMMEMMDGGHSM